MLLLYTNVRVTRYNWPGAKPSWKYPAIETALPYFASTNDTMNIYASFYQQIQLIQRNPISRINKFIFFSHCSTNSMSPLIFIINRNYLCNEIYNFYYQIIFYIYNFSLIKLFTIDF